MIHESSYWKVDLLRRREALLKRKTQRVWRGSSCARAEQDLLLGFFSVRKLIDSHKVSEVVAGQKVRLREYAATKKIVQPWRRLDIDENYDLERPIAVERGLRYVCNQFIHSHLLILSMSESGGMDGVFCVSDWERKNRLFFLGLEEALKLFLQIGNNYPRSAHVTWCPKSEDYIIRIRD